jgi:hypothetical protein
MTESMVVQVGKAEASVPMEADAVEVDGYRVTLVAQPSPVLPGDMTHLHFTLSKNGKPVVDAEPIEGMPAYCVVAGERLEVAHPMGGKENFGGPEIRFHAYFPRDGLYSVCLTFRHQGKLVTARLGVRVQPHRSGLDPGQR